MNVSNLFDLPVCNTSLEWGVWSKNLPEYIAVGFVLPPVAFFGFLANMANIWVLSGNGFVESSATYFYLLVLAVVDAISLFLHFWYYVMVHLVGGIWPHIFSVYVYWPLAPVSLSTSLLLTTAITIHRHVLLT